MTSVSLPRLGIVLLLAAVLFGGMVLGSVLSVLGDPTPGPSASVAAVVTPSADPDAIIPSADVAGEDLERLPRYPGSIRSEHEVIRDGDYRLTTTEYLVDAEIDRVRTFYQGVINDHGWSRADIAFAGGEWTYVLVDGRTEALVEIEEARGVIEIDLQLSEPISEPAPEGTPRPTPQPTPQPAAPPPPGDDGGDDDDDDSDDDSDDDGPSDG